jgi:hypothetical protein
MMHMKKSSRLIGAVFLLAGVAAFASNTMHSTSKDDWHRLALKARQSCGEADFCTIHVGEVFDSTWDRMAVFGPMVSKLGVEKIIKHEIPDFNDYCTTFVFLDVNGNIVRFMQVDCGDGASKGKGPQGREGGFVFDGPHHFVIPRARDELKVHRYKLPAGEFFEYSYSSPPVQK